MKKSIALTLLATALSCTAFAQDAFKDTKDMRSVETTQEKTALDIIRLDGSYVFERQLANDGGYRKQDVIQSAFEYSHRFSLGGKLYLRAGVAAERFDFGSTNAPVPNHLQSFAGVIGVEYMVGNDV